MNDKNEKIAKTVSTLGIWFATMIIFVSGVFRFNWNGLVAGLIWAFIALALCVAPTVATVAIWANSREKGTPDQTPEVATSK
jgi:hypothetical protein